MIEEGTQRDFGESNPPSDGLRELLDTFRQGDIVDDVPLFFGNGAEPLWKPERRHVADGDLTIVSDAEGQLTKAMIVTQACDFMRSDNPWVTMCPVYEATSRLDAGQLGNATSGRTGHLIHLTADWAQEEIWLADLRLEMPFEKTILRTKSPIAAFASEEDYSLLAERLGSRRQRPAVPDNCLEHVVGPMFDAIRARGDHRCSAGVREIRVQCDNQINARLVTLLVIASDDGNVPDEEAWNELLADIYQGAAEQDITVLGPEITTLDVLTARELLTSSPVADSESS